MTRLRVTDHAVLRYLERVGGFDIRKLRSEMTRRITEARVPGTSHVQLDGISFVIREEEDCHVVTTTMTGGAHKPSKKRKGCRK